MRVLLTTILLFAIALMAAAPMAQCTCKTAKLVNGRCEPCEIGYVAGVEVRSSMLYDALDAHGHDINPASIRCQTCRDAMATDGYCEPCHRGFIDKKLYFSKLTYLVALGEPTDVTTLQCPTCRASAACRTADCTGLAWCDNCNAGMVGNVRYKDKARFDAAVVEYRRLLTAIETSRRCEYCGVAQFMRSGCPTCRINYRDEAEHKQ